MPHVCGEAQAAANDTLVGFLTSEQIDRRDNGLFYGRFWHNDEKLTGRYDAALA